MDAIAAKVVPNERRFFVTPPVAFKESVDTLADIFKVEKRDITDGGIHTVIGNPLFEDKKEGNYWFKVDPPYVTLDSKPSSVAQRFVDVYVFAKGIKAFIDGEEDYIAFLGQRVG